MSQQDVTYSPTRAPERGPDYSKALGGAAVAVSSLLPMPAPPGLTKRWVVILDQRISVGPVMATACEQLHPAGALLRAIIRYPSCFDLVNPLRPVGRLGESAL